MPEKVPRLLAGVDVRKLKLDAMDGFLLTRIDGKLDPKGLARDTGLPDFSVVRALEKLEKLGVIEIVDPNAPPPAPVAAAAAPAERKSTIAQFDDGIGGAKYDPSELEEVADLQPAQKKRILDFYYRLDDLDHYTLLGVTAEANKKDVKRAYFELAGVFHPDRYFKKELGSFKPKMEVLFNRITEAHDTLVDAEKRVEYDAYLAEVATTRGMEAMLDRAMAESSTAADAAAAAAAEADRKTPDPVIAMAPAAPPPAAAPAGPSAEDIRARKEALARRLTGGARKVASIAPPEPPKPSPLRYTNTQDAVDALKRRYEERIESATNSQAQRYITSAEDALAKNDLVAASTAFSIATKFAPADEALAQRAKEVKGRADLLLCESYLKQAMYEERQSHWQEAARSWVKVAKIKNDAVSHERAANSLFRSPEADLHVAADHAKQAISLDPDNVANHITLVEIYFKAGLTTSARRAADAAMTLDPQHEGLQALLKKMGKG